MDRQLMAADSGVRVRLLVDDMDLAVKLRNDHLTFESDYGSIPPTGTPQETKDPGTRKQSESIYPER